MQIERGQQKGREYIKDLIYRLYRENQEFEPTMIIGNTPVDVRALLLGRYAANIVGIDIPIKSPLQSFIVGVAFDQHGEVLAAVHLTEEMMESIPKDIGEKRWLLRAEIAKHYFQEKQIPPHTS